MILPTEVPRPAHELVQELIRVFKARRLYGAGHPQRTEIESSATGRIQALLEEFGPIELVIGEDTLSHEEEVVYRQSPGPESLAFLLFREGLRQIAFYPGLEISEVAAFLDHLSAAAQATGSDSDFLARLWEEKLVHVRYVFVEQLSDHEWVPEAAGRAESEAGRERPPIRLEREDREEAREGLAMETDVTLYFLDDEDLATLQAELEEEKDRTLLHECLTCLRELLMDPVRDDADPILRAVAEVQASLLEHDAFEMVRALHALFEPHIESEHAGAEARAAFRDMRRAALDPVVLQRLAARLDAEATRDIDGASYYRAFGGEDLPSLLISIPDIKRLCQRESFAEAFTDLAAENLAALKVAVLSDDPHVACAAAYLAGLVADLRLVEPLGVAIGAHESRVRLEALLALKHFDDPRAVGHVARMIDDPDAAIRLYALRHVIARRYDGVLATVRDLLDRTPVNGRPLAERRLLFEAYGTLGGAGVVDDLASRLKRCGGLFRKADPEEMACLLVGLAATRTEEARQIVERVARSRDPLVQRVAHQVLAAWGEAGSVQ